MIKYLSRFFTKDQSDPYRRIGRLEKRIELLFDEITQADQDLRELKADLAESERHLKDVRYEADELREKLEIAQNVTVPQLIASNELALQRTRADIEAVMHKR